MPVKKPTPTPAAVAPPQAAPDAETVRTKPGRKADSEITPPYDWDDDRDLALVRLLRANPTKTIAHIAGLLAEDDLFSDDPPSLQQVTNRRLKINKALKMAIENGATTIRPLPNLNGAGHAINVAALGA